MEILVGAVVALLAWMLWNGLKPPGATVQSSLERERRRRKAKRRESMLRVMIVSVPPATASLVDSPVLAVTLGV
jgi:hypothetical protein